MEVFQLTDGHVDLSNLPILHYDANQATMELVGVFISKDITLIINQATAYLDKCLRKGKLHFSYKNSLFSCS